MAELADALDLKSSSLYRECGFDSHSGHLCNYVDRFQLLSYNRHGLYFTREQKRGLVSSFANATEDRQFAHDVDKS